MSTTRAARIQNQTTTTMNASTYESFEIHATSIFGHSLHWDGEKFTDQGEAWSFGSLDEAKSERIDRENMETITLYGWTDTAREAITTL